jgi:uncharacterized protein (TIGR03083 family)
MTDPQQDSSLGEVRSTLMSALTAFVDLLHVDAVGAAWDEPSALSGYTVGALAAHVLSTASAIERYLDLGSTDDVPIPKGAYYAVVPSTTDAPDLHADIRTRAATLAERGRQTVIEDLVALSARLRERLALEPVTRTVVVMGGNAMALDDYLETRVIELVVHCDDLAVSVGATADIPADAASIAVSHLLEVARQRHGDMALLRAFTRRERDDAAALRVF